MLYVFILFKTIEHHYFNINALMLSLEHVLLYKSFLFIYIIVKYIRIILYILRYIFYKMLYIINTLYNLIILKIACNIEVHCIGQPANGRLKSHTKKCLESENNMVGHMTFWVWPTMSSWDPNKNLTLTNIINTLQNMFIIIHISII